MFCAISGSFISLNFNRADDPAHHGHWRNQRRLRSHSIVGTNQHRRMTQCFSLVVVGDDYLISPNLPTVYPSEVHRHWWQLAGVDLFAVAPAVASGTHIANRIVQ